MAYKVNVNVKLNMFVPYLLFITRNIWNTICSDFTPASQNTFKLMSSSESLFFSKTDEMFHFKLEIFLPAA